MFLGLRLKFRVDFRGLGFSIWVLRLEMSLGLGLGLSFSVRGLQLV